MIAMTVGEYFAYGGALEYGRWIVAFVCGTDCLKDFYERRRG
jgi:hypothetical protein